MDRCSCRVKFRIAATAFQIKLEGQGEHTAESHVQDKVSKFLTIQQSAALEQMVSTNPKKPHLKDKILQCAAHLTGIAWQKRSHTKFFDDQKTYKRADWFEEYWTGERGNYTLAHAEAGRTNNNCGVEGRLERCEEGKTQERRHVHLPKPSRPDQEGMESRGEPPPEYSRETGPH